LRTRIAVIVITSFILFFGSVAIQAQIKVLRVDSSQTDPAIETVHGPNIAVYDPQATPSHLLLLFFVGTNSKATGGLRIGSAFAKWGYHAISLDYENKLATATLSNSLDDKIFGNYRDAIVTGAPVSKAIQVSPANSILNRFQKLLVYLVKTDPSGGWGEFLANGKPIWSRVVVAGHSQGSGHAAYVGKLFEVNKVLMFSGPQDYLNNFNEAAPWQARKGATPPSRYFAFLNLYDPFNVLHQVANCEALMDTTDPNMLIVKPGDVIHGDFQIFINNFPNKQHHGSTLFPKFENVWKYMATTGIS
jgi:hypothetical protein